MKLAKSLLLGSAAGLVAVAGAQAADLPTRKAAPVEYVRVCATYGNGFFYIPGTDTCIKINGHARFDYVNTQEYNKGGDPSSFRGSARIGIDTRTATDWGLLRTYIRLGFSRDSGGYFGSGTGLRTGTRIGLQTPAGGFPSYSGIDSAGARLETGVFIDAAFVQWGGLTAGRVQSFFDFYADNDTWFGIADSDTLTTALAYTYQFSNGFSATLSVEDPKQRQAYPIAGLAPVGAGGINPSVASPPFTNVYPFAFSPYAAPFVTGINYVQRESVPDVVGVLRVDQGWGSAQLSGAYHRVSSEGSTLVNLTPTNTGVGFTVNPLVSTVPGGFGTVTANGWAIQGGVKLNVPMIAAGDYLYLEAAYAKGASSYANSGFPGQFSAGGYPSVGSVGNDLKYDAVVGPTGHMTLTPDWSAMASYEHYWTPTIRQGIFASVDHFRYSSAITTAAAFAQGAACPACLGTVTLAMPGGATPYNPYTSQYLGSTTYYAGTNVIWSPVKGLDIGVEVYYARDDYQHKTWDLNKGGGKLVSDADVWLERLRISRDF